MGVDTGGMELDGKQDNDRDNGEVLRVLEESGV